jgi:predicted RNA-binding Zn-ribbon protein involved in translation (DUF1610 family)
MRKQLTVEARQRGIITRVTNENKRLRERVKYLEEENAKKDKIIESLLLRIEELEKIVFGSKNKKDRDGGLTATFDKTLKTKVKRDTSSYRRAVPSESEITKEENHTIDNCPDCGSFLSRKRKTIRYIEDILLPYLNTTTESIYSPGKEIVKQTFEKGYCKKCKCWHSANKNDEPPPKMSDEVILGNGIKKYILYKTYVLRLTYQQIQDELKDLYNIKISDGEIANILDKASQNKLKIPYE